MSEQHEYVPNRAPMGTPEAQCIECERPFEDPVHLVPEELKERMIEEVKKLRGDVEVGEKTEWAGDSPFFLVFERGPRDNVGLDIDTGGWIEANKELFRTPGVWLLMHKAQGRPVLAVVLREDEQFYWTKHHVGNLMAGAEVTLYGMGKKQADGNKVNLWLMPNGMVVGGPEGDADLLAARMLGAPAAP